MSTVVMASRFYYVLTTFGCHNLPHSASFCRFTHFSWQNDSAPSRKGIAANRGNRRLFDYDNTTFEAK